ncbi:TetR/AcrR family transcriptional regulator [Bacillus sp. 3255]|uniref:TetR/AcrR family transcriptional regulator n=1 Tax=Bacillus sp. 3255 TaxID=2817904 RepID=UPI00286654AF|nr:TetR/AcrR family transcriptional regulator [Bacillus sp. 3255]MDR6879870.1 AcrR family transcriptional regulator [Bacillus sp. 3255]
MSKREDILNATLDLIDEEGLQSVTFAKIMKRANVGSGTVFNYFSNKEELVHELYRQCRKLLGDNLMMNYNAELSLYERFKCLQTNRIRFALAFPKHFRFIDSYSYSPCITPELRKLEDDSASREAILSLLKEGQRNGIIREMDINICNSIIHGVITAIVKGYYVNKYPLNDMQIQQTLEASWKSILV